MKIITLIITSPERPEYTADIDIDALPRDGITIVFGDILVEIKEK